MANCERGGSNTPVTRKCDTDNVIELDRRVVIDWVSYTFDDIDFAEAYDNFSKRNVYNFQYRSPKNDYIMTSLFRLLGMTDLQWEAFEYSPGSINSYTFTMYAGEHIRINFAGPRSSRDRPTTQILFSGQACSEYINYYGGDWIKFFDFFMKEHLIDGKTFRFHGRFKRVDIAIDDFVGDLSIYDLEKPARDGHWVGSYQSLMVVDYSSFRGGLYSLGYSLTFGSPTSSQLMIYDKNLERKTAGFENIKSDVWYRYEMRFVEEKADSVIAQFLIAAKSSDQLDFGRFASSCLLSCIEFKVPLYKGNVTKNQKKSDWDIDPRWEKFVGDVSKLNLKKLENVELSILRKKAWAERSLQTTFAEFLCSEEDPESHFEEYKHQCSKGIKRLSKKSKIAINKYRAKMGYRLFRDSDFDRLSKKYEN